jgi:glutamyl/glutaminyl-tRNA synthetase
VSRDGGYPGTCVARGVELDAAGVSWRVRTHAGDPGAASPGDPGAASPGDPDAAGLARGAMGPEVLRVKTYPAGNVEARLPVEMRDFVVRKRDGFPAYQLSSMVDDLHYGVDLIVRGEDLWGSTLAQLYLSYPLGAADFADAAGFRDVRFYHHPLLMAGGEKLSKSAGATSIQYLRRQGISAGEIYGLIAREVAGNAEARDWEGLAALVLGVGR